MLLKCMSVLTQKRSLSRIKGLCLKAQCEPMGGAFVTQASLNNQSLKVICQSEVVLGLFCHHRQAWLCRETIPVVFCAVLWELLHGAEPRGAWKPWHGELGVTIPRWGEVESWEPVQSVLPRLDMNKQLEAEFAMFLPVLALSCMILMVLCSPVYFYVILRACMDFAILWARWWVLEYVQSAGCAYAQHWHWDCALKYPCWHHY